MPFLLQGDCRGTACRAQKTSGTSYQIVTTHTDRPGVVGKVGTLLGKENINIASMQLGRKAVRGEALMVLQVDDFMSPETVKKVEQLDVISTARFVELPEKNLNRNT